MLWCLGLWCLGFWGLGLYGVGLWHVGPWNMGRWRVGLCSGEWACGVWCAVVWPPLYVLHVRKKDKKQKVKFFSLPGIRFCKLILSDQMLINMSNTNRH